MFSIGQKLFQLYNKNNTSDSTSDDSARPSFGRPVDPNELLSSMSAAVPDDDTKWQLTNIGGIGSDEDKELRGKAAESEAEFEGAGQEPGLEIWRVEKFSPERLSVRADNLSLYSGDSYIILKTTKKEDSDALDWQIHYWIGKDSTQDEFGAAAYFAVNLDDLLGGKPVQHRELQYSESALFHSYFRSVTYLDGGIDSGFKKVEPEEYTPRLLQMASIGGTVRVLQVPRTSTSLNNGDVFILDNGMTIYQFNAPNASVTERVRAMEIANEDLRAERDLEPELINLDGDEVFLCEAFWELLGGKLDELPEAEGDREVEAVADIDFSAPKKMCRISNETGALVITLVKEDVDTLSHEDVDAHDVWAIACDNQCFMYVGDATNKDEKFYVWNRCDAILLALGLDKDAPVTFFSRESDVAIWDQLFTE